MLKSQKGTFLVVNISLEDIEFAFNKLISSLWNIRSFILDVKATRWHDDYNSFKQGVKDLEVMMQNLIFSAFGTTFIPNNYQKVQQLLKAESHYSTFSIA